jgi:hypothetical protein
VDLIADQDSGTVEGSCHFNILTLHNGWPGEKDE